METQSQEKNDKNKAGQRRKGQSKGQNQGGGEQGDQSQNQGEQNQQASSDDIQDFELGDILENADVDRELPEKDPHSGKSFSQYFQEFDPEIE